jgi:hypothetical protein
VRPLAAFPLYLALAITLALAPPAAAQTASPPPDDRWQLALNDGSYVWDVRLVRLEGDSIVVRQADSLVRVPVGRVTELRLVRPTELMAGERGPGAIAALTGASDDVYDLASLDYAERLATVRRIFAARPAPPPP